MATAIQKIHPKLKGKFKIPRKNYVGEGAIVYTVDLDKNTCSCPLGSSHVDYGDGIAKDNKPCAHKIQAIGKLAAENPDELTWPYIQVISSRYNQWEAVSAFHKELRRGDIEKSFYFGSILARYRGVRGVIKYMINIIYEETRDHYLHGYLLDCYKQLSSNGKTQRDLMIKTISAFCRSPKKWQLPHRLDDFFIYEMQGYSLLAKEYGWDVAKPKDIIPESERNILEVALIKGFETKDKTQVQRGLKGLFKSKSYTSHEEHKDYIYRSLCNMHRNAKNKFTYSESLVDTIIDLLERRYSMFNDIGYHELNTLCDALCGEPYTQAFTVSSKLPELHAKYENLQLPYGKLYKIPLYAQDNHTYKGKALMAKYPEEVMPNAKQIHIDFRWCGAYFGVAWRYFAYKQHGTCFVPWDAVKWLPSISKTVQRMWY